MATIKVPEYERPVYKPENLNGHCWHYAGLDELEHEEFVCCRCGCGGVAHEKIEKRPPEGHGPHHPATQEVTVGHEFYPGALNCHKGPSQ